MSIAEISQKKVITFKNNQNVTPDEILNPDAPETPNKGVEVETEDNLINLNTLSHIKGLSNFEGLYEDLIKEFGFLYTTTFFDNQMCIARI